jgi:RNase P subunit RPR2
MTLKIPHSAPDITHTMGVPKRTKTKTRPEKSANGMHSCPSCSSVLVQPVNWHEQDDGYWQVELRCPECEWFGRDSYSQSEVDTYDEELDRGGQELIEDLRSLTRANMEEEAERFALALGSDSILPEDF